jgi:hypothetical protein
MAQIIRGKGTLIGDANVEYAVEAEFQGIETTSRVYS